ncbi:nuclease-related domain-containing protein [Methanocella sp. MCL-LM]|uniref:nuclease-related domain-containing protein n=1 Tax=Methanocella sp. MCL-LM TaxID=3412035 RepID=UPI003C71189F
MATLIGGSGAGDDLIRKLHESGVSRSCTTIRQVMERREAIDRAIEHERMRQNDLLEHEIRNLRNKAIRRQVVDSLLFFRKSKKTEEITGRVTHLRTNREAIVENNLMYLYREKDVLDRLTREYRSELKGYYGELLVMDSLKQLGDDYYVISDVKITRAYGHRFDGRMLKSARVDHIVVGRKGVYCIETKNWNSIKKTDDKPSPGEQARRASHLLYKYLKFTCGMSGVKVMGIVLYTNIALKGREDFVRFMRNDEIVPYLEARPDNIDEQTIKVIVDHLKDRDIVFDDSHRESLPDEDMDAEDVPAENSRAAKAAGSPAGESDVIAPGEEIT